MSHILVVGVRKIRQPAGWKIWQRTPNSDGLAVTLRRISGWKSAYVQLDCIRSGDYYSIVLFHALAYSVEMGTPHSFQQSRSKVEAHTHGGEKLMVAKTDLRLIVVPQCTKWTQTTQPITHEQI